MKQQYFQLSKKYHPDFVTTGTDAEKEEALEISSQINKAYKVLMNEDETIKYVLQEKSILMADEKYDLPKEFLMEMMELNEEVMDLKFDIDNEKVEKIKQSIVDYQSSIKGKINNIISFETIDNITDSDLLAVKDYYFKKKYLNRILDSIN